LLLVGGGEGVQSPTLAPILFYIYLFHTGYQIHSWDDLDEWHQAFRKSDGLSGEAWFKIDPHFMPAGTTSSSSPSAKSAIACPTLMVALSLHAEFCASQSRVPSGDSRGCLVLSHDTPTTQSQYNSTQDLLLLLQDPSFLPFFTQQKQYAIRPLI
jgi:hypothetical protein